MKKIFYFYLILVFIFTNLVFSEDYILEKRSPRRYKITITIFPQNNTLTFSKYYKKYIQVLGIPVPNSNEYQEVSNIKTTHGFLTNFNGKEEQYIRAESSTPFERVVTSYNITVYSIKVNFNKIKKIYPYNTESELYRVNTSYYDENINPDHPKIVRIANEEWRKSNNVIDYARKLYIRLQKDLKWKNTGNYRGLDNIFSNGGGDCAALSSVYISLLRNKGIPARNVTGWVIYNNKKEDHVWVEFYLENYGWIPADPSYFTDDIDNICFGNTPADRIILHRGLDFPFFNGLEEVIVPAYQSFLFAHWLWEGKVYGDFELDMRVDVVSN